LAQIIRTLLKKCQKNILPVNAPPALIGGTTPLEILFLLVHLASPEKLRKKQKSTIFKILGFSIAL